MISAPEAIERAGEMVSAVERVMSTPASLCCLLASRWLGDTARKSFR